MKKRGRKKKLILISSCVLLSIIIIFIILNLFLRKPFPIERSEEELLKIFPQDFIKNYQFKVYQGGIIPSFSSITLCNSVYLKPSDLKNEVYTKKLIIHETVHLYQVRKGFFRCVHNGASSLIHQFRAFLLHGSRGYAYFYPLDASNNIFSPKGDYNPEQEAEIIEDYYYLNYLEGNQTLISCYRCDDYSNKKTCYTCSSYYSKEEIINSLKSHYKKIMEKYS